MDEQPRAIAESFREAGRRFRELGLAEAGAVTLVGSGSSLNCCVLASHFLDRVAVVPPADFLGRSGGVRREGELVVILTQSGASATSVDAANRARYEGASVVVVTANAQGTAAGLGLPTVLMLIGDEPIGPKTKGYAASCAALLALAQSRGAAIEPPCMDALGEALERARERARDLAAGLDRLDYVLAAGAGANHGTALEGSLKIAEIAGVPTAAFSMEETLHGRLHATTPVSLCMPIVSDAVTRAQAERIGAALAPHGVRVEPVSALAAESLPEPWSVLASTFLFQALAVELALRRGRNPDLMHYPGLTHMLDIKTDSTL